MSKHPPISADRVRKIRKSFASKKYEGNSMGQPEFANEVGMSESLLQEYERDIFRRKMVAAYFMYGVEMWHLKKK